MNLREVTYLAWLKTLADTYDVYAKLAGVIQNDQPVLLPLAHSTFNAQIEVTIDENGNFIDSRKVEKGKDMVTVIPVTEDSASRSSGIAPHPLCDKLCYIAGDYTQYTGDNKEEYYKQYMQLLGDWAESEETHFMVQAVYKYLEKKTLIHDLVEDHTLELNEKGILTDQIKLQNQGQTGASVRFIVHGNNTSVEASVWKNHELYQQFIQFYQKRAGKRNLCYVSGTMEACSDKHPSKIRNSGDKAKLLSGNDEAGFTYRGRFTTKDQAVAVGYEVSQKAHNALRWLVQKQGYTRDESAIVCWMINRDMPLPNVMKDSINGFADMEDFDCDALLDDTEADNPDYDTGMHFAEQFRNAVNGYAGKIKTEDKVAIISLEAATTGRLSVVYYDEINGKQYMDAILNWQEHCKWRRTIKVGTSEDTKKRITLECTPSPRDMALAAFGIQKSEWLDADSKLLRATVKRLLPCITKKGSKIPRDIIKAAARRASMPETMSDFVWRNDVLSVVCAMIRYAYEGTGGKTMNNFLEDNKDDRSVLFGRLLAVCDYMERRALFEKDENGKIKETRSTNAKRYWNAYSSRPAKTYQIICENLRAYERKLNDYQLKQFEEWTQDIMEDITRIQGFTNQALSELYLPAYYQQLTMMKNAFQKKND